MKFHRNRLNWTQGRCQKKFQRG